MRANGALSSPAEVRKRMRADVEPEALKRMDVALRRSSVGGSMVQRRKDTAPDTSVLVFAGWPGPCRVTLSKPLVCPGSQVPWG